MSPAPRMPKRARYPIFALGLAVLVFGDLAANAIGVGASTFATITGVGFILMLLSVAIT